MASFITEDFLLQTKTAQQLYHEYAEDMPIYDYHCHLPARQIAEDHCFENITQAWLYGDHYKWRAMRTQGVPEDGITGNASDYEKFVNWANTVPHTLRNPLYHWTHLELKRYFGIDLLLGPDTAERIEKLELAIEALQNEIEDLKKSFQDFKEGKITGSKPEFVKEK